MELEVTANRSEFPLEELKELLDPFPAAWRSLQPLE